MHSSPCLARATTPGGPRAKRTTSCCSLGRRGHLHQGRERRARHGLPVRREQEAHRHLRHAEHHQHLRHRRGRPRCTRLHPPRGLRGAGLGSGVQGIPEQQRQREPGRHRHQLCGRRLQDCRHALHPALHVHRRRAGQQRGQQDHHQPGQLVARRHAGRHRKSLIPLTDDDTINTVLGLAGAESSQGGGV